MKHPIGKMMDAARSLIAIVDVVREGSPTDREVQCEGEKDETETGREVFRTAWHLGPGGLKHRARKGEKGVLLRICDGILFGMVDDENAPTDLDEGETAMFNAADSGGTSVVRCKGAIIEIGSGSGGKIMRVDFFKSWWTATPTVNYAAHGHTGSMPGPGTSGPPNNTIGTINDGDLETTEGHTVR